MIPVTTRKVQPEEETKIELDVLTKPNKATTEGREQKERQNKRA